MNSTTAPVADVIDVWEHDRRARRRQPIHTRSGFDTGIVDDAGMLCDPLAHRRINSHVESPGGAILDALDEESAR